MTRNKNAAGNDSAALLHQKGASDTDPPASTASASAGEQTCVQCTSNDNSSCSSGTGISAVVSSASRQATSSSRSAPKQGNSSHQGISEQEGESGCGMDDSQHSREALQQQIQQLQLELASRAASPEAAPEPRAVGDVVTLNVGGKLFSCHRQTLCLVKESLLDLMFSGRWPDHGARDADGHVFLDLDPSLFEVVLNWLRRFNMSHSGNIPEPVIPEDKVVHMLAMLDYLQLHRHIPITYHETFDQQHYSPFMMVLDSTATRTAVAAQHQGKHTTGLKNTLMQFAVSDTAHSYFDMHVDITFEIIDFQESVERGAKPQFMFIGFMHKAAVAQLSPAGDVNTRVTSSPGCYGWLVGGKGSYTVRNGKRSEVSCTKDQFLWNQGEQIVITLDSRRDRRCASLSILNTVTGVLKTLDAEAVIGQSSRNSIDKQPAEQGQGEPTASSSKQRRLGLRHRIPSFVRNAPGGVSRQEILAVLARQPVNANNRAADLVVGAAMQVLEAQGLGTQAALNILRQPGLVQRLVHQVQHVQRFVREHVREGPANGQQDEQLLPVAVAVACAGVNVADAGIAAAGSSSSAAGHAANGAAAADSMQQQPQHLGVVLSSGCRLPESTAEYDWVLVVGLVHPKDSVRILSVKRRGQRPQSEL